jgi:hypothetical protein
MFSARQELIDLIELVDNDKRVVRDDKSPIEEMFAYLRTCIKYSLFERDALVRENNYYQRLLKGDDNSVNC